MLTPRRLACAARDSSSVNVVRVVAAIAHDASTARYRSMLAGGWCRPFPNFGSTVTR
jgi:hypothetical protein